MTNGISDRSFNQHLRKLQISKLLLIPGTKAPSILSLSPVIFGPEIYRNIRIIRVPFERNRPAKHANNINRPPQPSDKI